MNTRFVIAVAVAMVMLSGCGDDLPAMSLRKPKTATQATAVPTATLELRTMTPTAPAATVAAMPSVMPTATPDPTATPIPAMTMAPAPTRQVSYFVTPIPAVEVTQP